MVLPNSLIIRALFTGCYLLYGAIDNTKTYPQSINYANKDYYTMYDPESGFKNPKYYPTPADVIPTSQYLKAVEYGQGNAWPLSVTSPGFFIFQTKNTTPAAFANDAVISHTH